MDLKNNQTNVLVMFLIVLLMGTSLGVGILWAKLQTSPQPSTNNNAVGGNAPTGPVITDLSKVQKLSDSDYAKGNRQAKIALIEYSDLECPYCKRFHPTAQQAVDEYGDEIVWVYRHFPLESIHPLARTLANAAECSGKVGGSNAFWGFVDGVSEAPTVVEDDIPVLAEKAGVTKSAFTACWEAKQLDSEVDADLTSGQRAGVQGTPGNFVLNLETGRGVELAGAVSYATLKQAIEMVKNDN